MFAQRSSLILSLGGVAPSAQATYPLPVALSGCANPVTTGPGNNKSIDVIWKVGSETNMANYEIESSIDGKLFSKIGSVFVKGNNSAYLFNDANPMFNQANYYRLKILENNQSAKYSTIVSAFIKSNTEIVTDQLKIYPNPSENLINILCPQSGIFDVNIKNQFGQVVYSKKGMEIRNGISTTIDFASKELASGVYYLQLIEKPGKILNGKFVKK